MFVERTIYVTALIRLLSRPIMRRTVSKFGIDLILWAFATPLAFAIRLDPPYDVRYVWGMLALLVVTLPFKAFAIAALRFHRRSWRKFGFRDLSVLGAGVAAVLVLSFAVRAFVTGWGVIPRSVPVIEAMVAVLLLGSFRAFVRAQGERIVRGKVDRDRVRRVLIAGAGDSGTMIAREMLRQPQARLVPVGFLDDDRSKQGKSFVGLKVLGTRADLEEVADAHNVDELVIAMPAARGEVIRKYVEKAQRAKLPNRTIPGLVDLVSGRVSISQLREVNLEDLLRRDPVKLQSDEIEAYLEGRRVLVTGAGGSIGSEIVRQVARFRPHSIVLLGRGENSIFLIEQEMRRDFPGVVIHPVICDVRDEGKLAQMFALYAPEVVFHAAAHKHVPLMEANPDQAIFNNVGGTRNVARMALEHGVERFVNISTDKAVNPTSVMGASKRAAEHVVYGAARDAGAAQSFVSVRFGNVLGSRGSVVPFFQRQIAAGGPVTVTHPEMKRYFMTIPEAAQLVLQAGALGQNGAVYVLDMGEPVKIVDLARDLILLSGLEPGKDIEVTFNGMRPGEKLFEELLTAEEGTDASRHTKIFVARKVGFPNGELEKHLDALLAAASTRDGQEVRRALLAMIPTARFETLACAEDDDAHAPVLMERGS